MTIFSSLCLSTAGLDYYEQKKDNCWVNKKVSIISLWRAGKTLNLQLVTRNYSRHEREIAFPYCEKYIRVKRLHEQEQM